MEILFYYRIFVLLPLNAHRNKSVMHCSYFVHGILVLYFADSLLFCCHAKRACKATTSM